MKNYSFKNQKCRIFFFMPKNKKNKRHFVCSRVYFLAVHASLSSKKKNLNKKQKERNILYTAHDGTKIEKKKLDLTIQKYSVHF